MRNIDHGHPDLRGEKVLDLHEASRPWAYALGPFAVGAGVQSLIPIGFVIAMVIVMKTESVSSVLPKREKKANNYNL